MKKYWITPHQESSVLVKAERMELLDKQLTLFVGDQIKAHFPHIESVVVNELEPLPALSAAEPISYTTGVVSSFLSPVSPLVEAIDSVARLVEDLKLRDRPGHVGPPGPLVQHLDALLAEQRVQLCTTLSGPRNYKLGSGANHER